MPFELTFIAMNNTKPDKMSNAESIIEANTDIDSDSAYATIFRHNSSMLLKNEALITKSANLECFSGLVNEYSVLMTLLTMMSDGLIPIMVNTPL